MAAAVLREAVLEFHQKDEVRHLAEEKYFIVWIYRRAAGFF